MEEKERANKRLRDFYKGKERRERAANYINRYLEKRDSPIRVKRIHPFLKTMKLPELTKNNLLKNQIIETSFRSSISLHYIVTNILNGKRFPVIFIFDTGSGIYIKTTKEGKNSPETYLDALQALNYHIIVVDHKNWTYSRAISLEELRQHWRYKLASSKGNTNRIQFYGDFSKIVLYRLGEGSLFTPPIELQFKKVLTNGKE